MSYSIVISDRFRKNYKRLQTNEKKLVKQKLELFECNPMHPSLRTKKIKGSDGLFEFSVNMDIRVVWHYEGDTLILLLDVGHHDILSRI